MTSEKSKCGSFPSCLKLRCSLHLQNDDHHVRSVFNQLPCSILLQPSNHPTSALTLRPSRAVSEPSRTTMEVELTPFLLRRNTSQTAPPLPWLSALVGSGPKAQASACLGCCRPCPSSRAWAWAQGSQGFPPCRGCRGCCLACPRCRVQGLELLGCDGTGGA